VTLRDRFDSVCERRLLALSVSFNGSTAFAEKSLGACLAHLSWNLIDYSGSLTAAGNERDDRRRKECGRKKKREKGD